MADALQTRLADLAEAERGIAAFLETHMVDACGLVLSHLTDPMQLRYVHASAAEQLHPRHWYMPHSICETSVTSWLLAYWRIRAHCEDMDA